MNVWILRLLAVFSLSALVGCANLSAIQAFGKLSSDAAGYTKLTQEYASSPARSKQFTLASENEQREAMEVSATSRKGDVAALALYHATLSEYMAAVADLAADEATSFDDEIGKLSDAALKQGYIEEREAKAVKSIGTLIAGALTDYYRQRKLKQVISQADAPLQIVVSAMRKIVGKAYASSLENERSFVRSYYRNLEQRARFDDKQSALAERIYAEGSQKQAEFDQRLAAARHYDTVLKVIGEAHHQLFANSEQVGSAEIQRQLTQYVKRIRATYKAVRGESVSGDDVAAAAAK